jgi:hypothetical protein
VRRPGFAVAVVLASLLTPPAALRAAAQELRFAQRWEDMTPQERDEARRNYDHYRSLSPEQQRAVERNYDRWQQLPDQEKDRIRGNYQRYREMSPEQRHDFQRRYHEWKKGR